MTRRRSRLTPTPVWSRPPTGLRERAESLPQFRGDPSASSTTACSTATACSRASASIKRSDLQSASSTSTACTPPPRPSALRSKRSRRAEMVADPPPVRRGQRDYQDGYIRLIVTRGVGTLGPQPLQVPRRRASSASPTRSALYPPEHVRAGHAGGHRRAPPDPDRLPRPADQEPQLPQQHPGQDRGHRRSAASSVIMLNTEGDTSPSARATTSS